MFLAGIFKTLFMEQKSNNPRFPEQNEPNKLHGTADETGQKEKYIRDSGKIEDLPKQEDVKQASEEKHGKKVESAHLTDRSGEEKKEDYINTDERKKDLDKRGL
jgi:hypothetical protein